MTAFEVFINEDGTAQCVYDDALQPLFEGEDVVVRRASHVEPAPGSARWIADMRPVNGPILMGRDGHGCGTRTEALAAEREWLAAEMAGRRL